MRPPGNVETGERTTRWGVGKAAGFSKSFMEEAAPDPGLDH